MAMAIGNRMKPEHRWSRVLHWLGGFGLWTRSRPARQLRVRETLPLGERRFLAVVEFEQQKFLIAGTGSSVSMLTVLPEKTAAGPPGVAASGEGPQPISSAREEVPTWQFAGASGAVQKLIRAVGGRKR
jgi:flagellar biogenesis protein FliO